MSTKTKALTAVVIWKQYIDLRKAPCSLLILKSCVECIFLNILLPCFSDGL